MTNLREEFCFQVRECRRQAGISQSILAREVGCKQSALSMVEVGDGTKLSEEVIRKIAEKFNLAKLLEESIIDKPLFTNNSSNIGSSASSLVTSARGFCPNPHCPSHARYEVDGRVFLKPNLEEQDPVHGKFCAVCGEILEKVCPSCGKPIHPGAVCSFCGEHYVCS